MQVAIKFLYLHLTGIPSLLDRLDPADVGDAAVQERAGLADKHTQSQRGPVRLCRGWKKRERRESGGGWQKQGEDLGAEAENKKEIKLGKEAEQANGQQWWTGKRE